MKQNTSFDSTIIRIASVVVLIGCVAVYLLLSKTTEVTPQTPNATLGTAPFPLTQAIEDKSSTPPNPTTTSSSPFPSVKITKWEQIPELETPSHLKTYTLKSNFTLDEAHALASALGAGSNLKRYGTTYFSYRADSANKSGATLLLDAVSGRFSYHGTVGVELPKRTSAAASIYAFLQSIGWYDDTLAVLATYERSTEPGYLWYEVKRDWQKTGTKILNPLGLLNTPSEIQMNNLSTVGAPYDTPPDETVINTSDASDGLARKTDFNTMSIKVHVRTGRIVAIESNLRKIVSGENTDKTPRPLGGALQENDTAFYVSPAGYGARTPWEKIYPNNTADADSAKIYDGIVAYVEQPAGIEQKKLTPHYLVRAVAELRSGYATEIIAVIPITPETQQKSHTYLPFLRPVYAQDFDPTQKQADFLLHTPTPDINPPTPTPNFNDTCIPRVEDLNPRSTIQSADGSSVLTVGRSHVAVINNKVQLSRRGWWYFTPAPNSSDLVLRNDFTNAIILIQSVTGQRDFRDYQDTTNNWGVYYDFQLKGSACPIRITGESPTIFVYGNPGQKISIKPEAELTYIDPFVPDSTWNITVGKEGIMLPGKANPKPYLYYEYAPTFSFQRPTEGWNIPKSELNKFATDILSKKLSLETAESKRLIFELSHAASDISDENIFVGIIPETEINTHLPLRIDPQHIPTYRYHFYVGKKLSEDIREPEVAPIPQTEAMILELGSFSED